MISDASALTKAALPVAAPTARCDRYDAYRAAQESKVPKLNALQAEGVVLVEMVTETEWE